MSFPDWIYKFTPRDEQTTPLEILSQRLTVSDANTFVDTETYTVPVGKILLLHSVGFDINPGAANSCIYAACLSGVEGETSRIICAQNFLDAAANRNLNWGRFAGAYLRPGEIIYGEAEFDAGATANALRMSITGILIPRGNFAV